MTQEMNDDVNAAILEAESSILRIADELGRMKTAAVQLNEAGKRSQLLQDAVENLVIEIGTLVESSGKVIDGLNSSELRGLVTETRTVLARRMDGLRTELLENTKSTTERVSAELREAMLQHLDALEKKTAARTESVIEVVATELCEALPQRLEVLEEKIANETRSSFERVSEDVVAVNEQRMSDTDEIMKTLDALGSQFTELQELVEESSRRKGWFS